MPHTDELLFVTFLLLAASTLAVIVFHRAGFGSVLGLLAAGVIVTSSGVPLGFDAERLREITELGVVFLLFIIGLEMEPRRLWAMRRAVFGLGSLQLLITGSILALLAMLAGFPPAASILLGLGLALSSTAFVVKLLEERGELVTEHGQSAFAVLIFQDMAVIPLLAAVPLLAGGTGELENANLGATLIGVVVALAGVTLVGMKLLPMALSYVARQRNTEAFTGLAVLAVIGAAWAMAAVGLSMALGAFLMGILLSRSRFHHQIAADVSPFKGMLLSLFFIAIGMSIDLPLLGENIFFVLGAVAALMAVKATVLVALGVLFRLGLPSAVRFAASLPQAGEFGFVLFAAASGTGLIADETFVLMILVISISMALTPLFARAGSALADRLDQAPPTTSGFSEQASLLERHVILCGFGRVGTTIAAMLEAAEIPYVAIDRDPRRVELGQQRGKPVFFGNAAEAAVLSLAGIGKASAVIVTTDKPLEVRRTIGTVRTFDPEVPLIARASDLAERRLLTRLGVNEATPEVIEMSIALGETTLRRVGVTEDRLQLITQTIRADDFAALLPPHRRV